MEDLKKSWQHGYDLTYLKQLESYFSEYNKYSLSPFTEVKKNTIAEGLHNKDLHIYFDDDKFDYAIDIKMAKTTSKIYMHTDTLLGTRRPGDVTFSKLVGNFEKLCNKLNEYTDKSCWMFLWTEDSNSNLIADACKFTKIGTKITSFGEMYNVYFRPKINVLTDETDHRIFPVVDVADLITIKKVNNVDISIIDEIRTKIKSLPLFTNHYSNYNKNKSWSALSLRGYTSDPSFITKPSEMNDKWKAEYRDSIFYMQDTPLYKDFPEVRDLIKQYGENIHRVRFMKLKSGNGELTRHTDQVDSESGGSKGKLARLHFPIITNNKVIFTVWDLNGKPQNVNMKEGECWMLDTRKPHMAINGGDEDRIHLVVDVQVDNDLYNMLVQS